jgi:hypothetical protein
VLGFQKPNIAAVRLAGSWSLWRIPVGTTTRIGRMPIGETKAVSSARVQAAHRMSHEGIMLDLGNKCTQLDVT